MAYDNKLKMDPDALNVVAGNIEDTALAMGVVGTYAADPGLKPADFGKTQYAAPVGGAFRAAVDALATSVKKAQPYLDKVAAATRATAQSQKLNEEDAKWGFDKLNKDA